MVSVAVNHYNKCKSNCENESERKNKNDSIDLNTIFN